MIKEIVDAVTIPVMAKVRIGHFVEAQVGHHAFSLGIVLQLTMKIASLRFCNLSVLIISMNRKFSHLRMRNTILTNIHSKFPSSVVAETLAKPFVVSQKALLLFAPKARLVPATLSKLFDTSVP